MSQTTRWQKAIQTVTKPWTGTKSAPVMTTDLLDSRSYSRDTPIQNGNWFFGPNGVERFFSYGGHKDAMKAYQKCPPVPAIINRKAQCYVNGKVWILDQDGKVSESDVAKRLRKLMTQPNPFQTWKQFEAQGYIYQQIFGYSVVLAIKPDGFKENYYAKSLWNIPPFLLKIEETKNTWYEQTALKEMISKITLKYGGRETLLTIDDILILRDTTPSMTSQLLPESRLLAQAMPINNIIGAYESRNVLINYRGALGILSPEKDQFGVAPIDPDAKDELQRDFMRYGLTSEQWKFIISSSALKWQQMGIPTKDLMLIEEVVEGTKAICDAYGHPAQMLGIIDPKYDNWDAAEKGLYQNATIPEAESNYQQWEQFFATADHGLTLEKDFSEIPVLQADQVQQATARLTLNQAKKIEFDNGLITLNQWLEALGDEPLPKEQGDIRIGDIKNSNVPLAVQLGVGGVQSVITVLTDTKLSPEGKKATLTILFGIQEADAAQMVLTNPEPPPPAVPPTPPQA